MSETRETIQSLHAALVHSLAEIQVDLTRIVGISAVPQNAQAFIESYLALAGLPVKNESATGLRNGINLTFTVDAEFIPGTLEVFLSGNKLTPILDYTEHSDHQGFDLLTTQNPPWRLKSAPLLSEDLLVNYSQRVIFP